MRIQKAPGGQGSERSLGRGWRGYENDWPGSGG